MKHRVDPPPELADALARVQQAKRNYSILEEELRSFLHDHLRSTVKGMNVESGRPVFELPHPKESRVSGTPAVLVSQIAENLRTSLDYMVFQLSKMNELDLPEQVPQFVMAESKSSFKRQKKRLRYLTEEQRGLVERLQPFRGNRMLGILNRMANTGKHRTLLAIRDVTPLQIYIDDADNRSKYVGAFEYPMGEGGAMFAMADEGLSFVLMDRYDALPTLRALIGHVEAVLGAC